MALVIVVVLIACVAFAMWDSINPELPKGLRLPTDHGALHSQGVPGQFNADGTPVDTSAGSNEMLATSPNHWLVVARGADSRLLRDFSTRIQGGSRSFDAPIVYVSCYQSQLYAWVDTRLRAASDPSDPSQVRVQVDSSPAELWTRQDGQNLAIPNPSAFVQRLAREKPLHISIAFGEAPRQLLTLTTDGFGTVAPALASCWH